MKRCKAAGAKYHREYRGRELQKPDMVKAIIERTGVGRLAERARISPSVIRDIKSGKTKRIRQSTERKILAA